MKLSLSTIFIYILFYSIYFSAFTFSFIPIYLIAYLLFIILLLAYSIYWRCSLRLTGLALFIIFITIIQIFGLSFADTLDSGSVNNIIVVFVTHGAALLIYTTHHLFRTDKFFKGFVLVFLLLGIVNILRLVLYLIVKIDYFVYFSFLIPTNYLIEDTMLLGMGYSGMVFPRTGSLVGSANYFASVFVFAYLLIHRINFDYKIVPMPILNIIFIGSILATGSRVGIAFALVEIVISTFINKRSFRLVILGTLFVIFVSSQFQLIQFFLERGGLSFGKRLVVYEVFWADVNNFAFLGTGSFTADNYAISSRIAEIIGPNLHNFYIKLIVEYGVIISALIFAFYCLFMYSFRARQHAMHFYIANILLLFMNIFTDTIMTGPILATYVVWDLYCGNTSRSKSFK